MSAATAGSVCLNENDWSSAHGRGAAPPARLLHRLPSLNRVVPQHPPTSHRLRWAGRNAIFSLPWSAQSRSANQALAQLPTPSLTISSTAFAALTLRQPKSESLSWFHSCSEPSHNEAIVCSSRLTLLYIPAVDRHTNHSGPITTSSIPCQTTITHRNYADN